MTDRQDSFLILIDIKLIKIKLILTDKLTLHTQNIHSHLDKDNLIHLKLRLISIYANKEIVSLPNLVGPTFSI